MKLVENNFFKKYLYILKGHYGQLIWLVFGFVVMSIMELLGLGLIGPFIASVVDPGILKKSGYIVQFFGILKVESSTDKISILGCLVIFIFLLKNYFAFKVQQKVFSFSFNYRRRLIESLMSIYMAMPFEFFLERNSASIMNTVVGHTKMITDDMLLPSLKLLSDVIVLFSISLFLFIISPVAMIFLLSILLTTVFFYVRFVKPSINSYGEKISLHGEGLIRSINQSLGALKEIRVLNVESVFFNSISNAAKGSSESQTGFYSLMLIPRYLIEIVFVVFLVAYSFYISNYSDGPEYLISSLAVMGIAGMRMLPSITGISNSLATINYSTHALTKLYDDLRAIEYKGAIDCNVDLTCSKKADKFKSLSIQNVCFKYPKSKKNAIDNLTIELHEGDSIGLVGKSGSGKTTLVDLLLGLYSISGGTILFNNKLLDGSNLSVWLSQVAYIPQTPFLLDASLAENIAFGVSENEIDELLIYQAIEQAQLTEVLARLPDGISSKLGERGVKLSGGECQRVAIARAFYHNRNVFIFDEATSSLDAQTEHNVVEMIESLHGKKTMIVIAHRLSTVRHCDIIYKLENGSVISSGTFNEVFN